MKDRELTEKDLEIIEQMRIDVWRLSETVGIYFEEQNFFPKIAKKYVNKLLKIHKDAEKDLLKSYNNIKYQKYRASQSSNKVKM